MYTCICTHIIYTHREFTRGGVYFRHIALGEGGEGFITHNFSIFIEKECFSPVNNIEIQFFKGLV